MRLSELGAAAATVQRPGSGGGAQACGCKRWRRAPPSVCFAGSEPARRRECRIQQGGRDGGEAAATAFEGGAAALDRIPTAVARSLAASASTAWMPVPAGGARCGSSQPSSSPAGGWTRVGAGDGRVEHRQGRGGVAASGRVARWSRSSVCAAARSARYRAMSVHRAWRALICRRPAQAARPRPPGRRRRPPFRPAGEQRGLPATPRTGPSGAGPVRRGTQRHEAARGRRTRRRGTRRRARRPGPAGCPRRTFRGRRPRRPGRPEGSPARFWRPGRPRWRRTARRRPHRRHRRPAPRVASTEVVYESDLVRGRGS